jgi:hypothetical protein
MKRNRFWACALAIAASTLTGGAAVAQTASAAVPVYDSTQIALDRYTVIRRLGITGWESAFRIRGHGDVETAQRAVLTEAARFGADGVINLICFDQTDRIFRPAGYFCYGNAIRLKK